MLYATLIGFTAAFAPGSAPVGQSRAAVLMATPNAAPVYSGQYADELKATAAAMVMPGKVSLMRS